MEHVAVKEKALQLCKSTYEWRLQWRGRLLHTSPKMLSTDKWD